MAALSGLVPFFWPAGILGLIGLALGLSAKGRVKRGEATNKGAAVAGLVLGPVSLILSVVGAVITFKDVGDAVDEIGKATTGSSAAKKRRTRPGAAPQRTRRTTRPARCGYGARPVRVRDRLRPGTAPGRSPV
ncbi:DUF4190 domain-containing protein [Streptomyces pacificus]|uniref:DUF4190 domain-containing protein n=1 Tax=Streptomyces pacificus TaxID=2705029 RepID=UPI003530A6FC